MVNILKKRNSTTLDEIGLKHSLVRGRNESLENFHKRIIKANSNLAHSRFKIERSFEYASPMQGFEVFKITKTNFNEEVIINITETRIEISVDSVPVYRVKLEDRKFLKDLKADLDLLTSINVEVITNNEWEYLKTKNLVQNSSKRTENNFLINGDSTILPERDVRSIQDHIGAFSQNTFDDSLVVSSSQYSLEDGNVFHKYSSRLENVFYTYQDFPLYITWSPIRSYKINAEEFEDVLKDRIKNSETFGFIDENTEVDNTETVEVLSQRGAKIINKILEKHNTYWGK